MAKGDRGRFKHKMTSLEDVIKEQMKDPKFKKAYEEECARLKSQNVKK